MTKICKECEHFVTDASAPQCGRVRAPVLGTPIRSCETERLYGFDHPTAVDVAVKLGACGPDGTFWQPVTAPAPQRSWFGYKLPDKNKSHLLFA